MSCPLIGSLSSSTANQRAAQNNYYTEPDFRVPGFYDYDLILSLFFSPTSLLTAEDFFFLQSLPTIHSSYQSLEQMHWFEAIFKIFAHAIFEAIEVEGRSLLNFEAAISKFGNHFWKFGCQPWKSKTDLFMTNGSKVLIYLTFLSFLKDLLL